MVKRFSRLFVFIHIVADVLAAYEEGGWFKWVLRAIDRELVDKKTIWAVRKHRSPCRIGDVKIAGLVLRHGDGARRPMRAGRYAANVPVLRINLKHIRITLVAHPKVLSVSREALRGT